MIIKDLKEYIHNFEYDNIFMSEKRICFINNNDMKYIQIIGTDVYDILNCILNSDTNLNKIFNCKIQFTTDDWIKMYTINMTQIV